MRITAILNMRGDSDRDGVEVINCLSFSHDFSHDFSILGCNPRCLDTLPYLRYFVLHFVSQEGNGGCVIAYYPVFGTYSYGISCI